MIAFLYVFFFIMVSHSFAGNVCCELIGRGMFQFGMSKNEVKNHLGKNLYKMVESGKASGAVMKHKNHFYPFSTLVHPHYEGGLTFYFDSQDNLYQMIADLENISPNDVPKVFEDIKNSLTKKFGKASINDAASPPITIALWQSDACSIELSKYFVYGSSTNQVMLSVSK